MRTSEQSGEVSLLGARGTGPLHIALAFPNVYHVGMSNLGYQAVYGMLSSMPGMTCERVFLPDAPALARLRRTGKPLCSLESDRPLDSFHIIAFSLSFENDYLHILTMLSLGRIPLLHAQRTSRHPLVMAGGVAVFINPEPLADFFDLFVVGEAEEVLQEFCHEALHQHSGTGTCRDLAPFGRMPGVYVPSGYTVRYAQDGCCADRTAKPGFSEKIVCRHVGDVDRFPTVSCILTPRTEFADMGLVELSRGCARRCRFCASGSVYSPYRARAPRVVLENVDRLHGMDKKIGLLGAAVSDYPELATLLKTITDTGAQVSVSSLRADSLSEDIVRLLQQSGHKTFTIAPEAGTERLRRVIGKHLTGQAIDAAVQALARCRVPFIKLYFMVGLPTETDEDVHGIVELAKHIKHVYAKEAGGATWLNHIQLSVSPFVPKPWTPFQWHVFDDVAHLKRTLKFITAGLRSERRVQVTYDLPKWGYVQTLLSRGDRRVGRLLQKAFDNDGQWSRAFRDSDVNPDFYVHRMRSEAECFPWDFIEHRVKKEWLWQEYCAALGDEKRALSDR